MTLLQLLSTPTPNRQYMDLVDTHLVDVADKSEFGDIFNILTENFYVDWKEKMYAISESF